jgi:hypothetical protein
MTLVELFLGLAANSAAAAASAASSSPPLTIFNFDVETVAA